MFLKNVMRRNRPLVDLAISFHQQGIIQPDTYVIDLDQTIENATMILSAAKNENISLYFMLKQIGRNPYIAHELMKIGYKGAVVVDYREALVMMKSGIPLGNVGHLVQTPKNLLSKILEYGTEVMTVFSFEKLNEINDVSKELGIVQDIIVKVYSDGDMQYPGQEGGIELTNLQQFLDKAKSLENIRVVGATAFPAFLYDKETKKIEKTHNYQSIIDSIEIMKKNGCEIHQINAPSTTSVQTLSLMKGTNVTHGEPGHGLTGTTPAHAYSDLEEIPSVVYVSEVSHNFRENSYCYGGGHYRRSHIKEALCSDSTWEKIVEVCPMDPENIDYYFQLKEPLPISSTIVMAFRFQMFVTRSQVAIVKGIKSGKPALVGIYDNNGKKVIE